MLWHFVDGIGFPPPKGYFAGPCDLRAAWDDDWLTLELSPHCTSPFTPLLANPGSLALQQLDPSTELLWLGRAGEETGVGTRCV